MAIVSKSALKIANQTIAVLLAIVLWRFASIGRYYLHSLQRDVMTGADGIVMTGADGIVMTGADGFLTYGPNGIVMTGADGIVMTGADGIVITGADGFAYPNSLQIATAREWMSRMRMES